MPEGWTAQENGEGYVLTSENAGEVMVVAPHAYVTLQELAAAAAQSTLAEEGAQLQPAGPARTFGRDGLLLDLQGSLQGNAYACRAIGLLNQDGPGVLLLLFLPGSSVDEVRMQTADALAASIFFSKPATQNFVSEWTQFLAGKRLTFVSSYSSGSSGGYSMKRFFALCANQRFNFSSSSSVSMDVGGAFGNSSERDAGSGRWLIQAPMGQPILVLLFDDGRNRRHPLNYQGEQLYLDSDKYFVSPATDCQ